MKGGSPGLATPLWPFDADSSADLKISIDQTVDDSLPIICFIQIHSMSILWMIIPKYTIFSINNIQFSQRKIYNIFDSNYTILTNLIKTKMQVYKSSIRFENPLRREKQDFVVTKLKILDFLLALTIFCLTNIPFIRC